MKGGGGGGCGGTGALAREGSGSARPRSAPQRSSGGPPRRPTRAQARAQPATSVAWPFPHPGCCARSQAEAHCSTARLAARPPVLPAGPGWQGARAPAAAAALSDVVARACHVQPTRGAVRVVPCVHAVRSATPRPTARAAVGACTTGPCERGAECREARARRTTDSPGLLLATRHVWGQARRWSFGRAPPPLCQSSSRPPWPGGPPRAGAPRP
jgi:hypothetical protein